MLVMIDYKLHRDKGQRGDLGVGGSENVGSLLKCRFQSSGRLLGYKRE